MPWAQVLQKESTSFRAVFPNKTHPSLWYRVEYGTKLIHVFLFLIRNSQSNGERESESCLVMSDSSRPQGLYSPWNSPGQNTGVGSHSLLQGIFPTQGLNLCLPRHRWILYQLSYQGSNGETDK